MDENKNQSSGAPSSDTTSALFVSARKKQLEQQEEERRAKEKEEQRLAAEAEVRRLEREVEERRKRAEEETRRIAEESQAKNAMAAANPQAVLGTQPPQPPIWPAKKEPAAVAPKPATPGGGAAGLLKDKKKLVIIIGAVAALVLAVVLIIALSGGGGGGDGGVRVDPNMELYALYDDYGLSLNYPDGWSLMYEAPEPLSVGFESDYQQNGFNDIVTFTDVTETFLQYRDEYGDAISAGVLVLSDTIWDATLGGTYDEYAPDIEETYDGWAIGETDLEYETSNGSKFHIYLDLTMYENRLLLTVIDLPVSSNLNDRLTLCRRIADTAMLEELYYGGEDVGETGGLTYVTGAAIDNGDGTYTYSDSARNIRATFPTSMTVAGIGEDAIAVMDSNEGCVVGRNLSALYYGSGGSDAEFTRDYMLSLVYSDFATLYGEPDTYGEPYLFTDELAQSNRLGTGEMVLGVDGREIYIRTLVYHTMQDGQNTEIVMAKTFFVEVGNDAELEYLYNYVVNIVNVN